MSKVKKITKIHFKKYITFLKNKEEIQEY